LRASERSLAREKERYAENALTARGAVAGYRLTMAFDDVLELSATGSGRKSLHGLADERAGDVDVVEDIRVRAGRRRLHPTPTRRHLTIGRIP